MIRPGKLSQNPPERLMWEIRRRTRVVGAYPDGKSALMLVAARLRHVAATKWGSKPPAPAAY
jgi:transposase-like protein